MGKRVLGYFLWIIGILGFIFMLGGVGAMEVGSMAFLNATTWSMLGLFALAIVVFFGIPHYREMPKK